MVVLRLVMGASNPAGLLLRSSSGTTPFQMYPDRFSAA